MTRLTRGTSLAVAAFRPPDRGGLERGRHHGAGCPGGWLAACRGGHRLLTASEAPSPTLPGALGPGDADSFSCPEAFKYMPVPLMFTGNLPAGPGARAASFL